MSGEGESLLSEAAVEKATRAVWDHFYDGRQARKYGVKGWPPPAQHMPWWRGIAEAALGAVLNTRIPEVHTESGWPFGAVSACRLIAATGNPNERKEDRDEWAATMLYRPDVLAVEIERARERLEQAIAHATRCATVTDRSGRVPSTSEGEGT